MIRIKIDYKDVAKSIDTAAKQMPFVALGTANNLAFAAMKDEAKELDKHLDRPTPFTKRGYEVVKATNKARIIATVQARQIQNEYLKYQVEGGSRPPKGKANVVPATKNILNQYGNMPRRFVRSHFKAPGHFSGRPKGGGAAGLYQVLGSGTGRRLRMLVAYEQTVQYKKRLPFYEIAEESVERNKDGAFLKAWRYAMKTAK